MEKVYRLRIVYLWDNVPMDDERRYFHKRENAIEQVKRMEPIIYEKEIDEAFAKGDSYLDKPTYYQGWNQVKYMLEEGEFDD